MFRVEGFHHEIDPTKNWRKRTLRPGAYTIYPTATRWAFGGRFTFSLLGFERVGLRILLQRLF